MSLNEIKLQILADHYRNTSSILFEKLRQRDHQFVLVVALMVALLFLLYTPKEAMHVIDQVVSGKLGITSSIDFTFMKSVLWFLYLAFVLRYFQTVINIERQYSYIHSLESELSNEYDKKVFTREGMAYLSKYPVFLNLVSFLYTLFFPFLIVIIGIATIIVDYKYIGIAIPLFWFNAFICVSLIISTVLYLYVLHFKK